jgi:hypothetical protein
MKFVLSLCTLFFVVILPASCQVKVSETTLSLPATDEGPPDENPPFDVFSTLENYPYTMRTDIRATESMHAWRALVLENEYLKCTILPQLGGHIYTCVDKINGKPMFYANPSIKKAIIAYRGAWAAFGKEFNFPVSHNWVTISPIDWAYSSAPDGSASITVGNRDRVYGMDWTVEIVLRPKSTVLEEHVTLSNRSDQRNHYFWWNNAGVEIWNDSRIHYPTQFVAPDGVGDIEPWPIQKGKDLSLVANQMEQFSYFAYGSYEPFMGIYNPHTDSGVVHWADAKQVPAKKIFVWSLNSDGLMWRDRLSDNHSTYLEMQSGLFQDQASFGFLEPRQSVRFSEFWMPVRGIGAITRATLDGVVSLQRETQRDAKTTLKIAFNANHAIPDATIVVSDGDKTVLQETASLDPAVTWKHEIADPTPGKSYTFVLKNAKGDTLLTHTEGVYNVIPHDQVHVGPQPEHKLPDPAAWTDREFLAAGADNELQGDYIAALDYYQSGLTKFPTSLPLLKATGRLAVNQWHFEDASRLLAKAEDLAPADPETHYYRAIAETALDHSSSIRPELEAAHGSPSFRSPAGLLLAELLARQHNTAAALKLLADSCPASADDPRCIEETVALERAAGGSDKAKALLAESLQRYPTSLFLRIEAAKLGIHPKPDAAAPEINQHLAADTSRILNIVREYNRLGLYADSLELLSRTYPRVAPEDSEPAAPQPSTDPLLAYYRGFLQEKLGKSGASDYAAAAGMPLLYIFPNDPGDFFVLRAALAANSSDASAHFLLGALLFSKKIVDPALAELRQAESLNPKIPSLQASLGRALLEIKKQPADAAAEFKRGMQMEPANPALYLGLNEAMRQLGQTAAQRAAMMKTYPDQASMADELVRAFVDALRESGRNDEANALLAHRYQPAKEGQAPLTPQK